MVTLEERNLAIDKLIAGKKGKAAIKKWKNKRAEEEKRLKELKKRLSKKVESKRVLKKSKVTLHLKQKEIPSILSDPNRFFKDELEETKRSMFLRWYSYQTIYLGGEKIDE